MSVYFQIDQNPVCLRVAITTYGVCTVALMPFAIIYNKIANYYRRTSIELKRLNSLAKSPTTTAFTEMIAGCSSIRGYGASDDFVAKADRRFSELTNVEATRGYAGFWLTVRMQAMSSVLSCMVAAFGIATHGTAMEVGPSWIGLALIVSFEAPVLLMMTVMAYAHGEQAMNSIERAIEYIDELPREAPKESAPFKPDASWPKRGHLQLSSLCMRYKANLPLVLNRVSFEVAAGQHAGVVGRTGSGKSSIMQALFRIVECEAGAIRIDGIDISTIPLCTLRSRLAIISQDPVIYSTTLRENLDPDGSFSDEQIWRVLDQCLMRPAVEAMPEQLETVVAERGESFSIGQRQLLCIARVLLRTPKLLCLDEATASIDNESDAHVQSMIRHVFASTTTLTIAHRLHTVMDSDLIIVMDGGVLRECGPPQELLKNADSALSKMARSTT